MKFRNAFSKIFFIIVLLLATGWVGFVLYSIAYRSTNTPKDNILGFFFAVSLPVGLVVYGALRISLVSTDTSDTSRNSRFGCILGLLLLVLITPLVLIPSQFGNNRRCNTFEPQANLQECDLSNIDLHGINLSEANLDEAFLENTNLSGANLSDASMRRAHLSHANLTGALMQDADLFHAFLGGANLSNATLEGANLDSGFLEGVVGLTDEMLNSVSSWRGLMFEHADLLRNNAAPVCQGHELTRARNYEQDERLHPLVLIYISDQETRPGIEIPDSWWPARTQSIELVACVNEKVTLLEACNYRGLDGKDGFVNRYQNEITLKLVAASSGIVLLEKTLAGSTPSICPDEIPENGSDNYYGTFISPLDIIKELEPFVNPSGEIERLTISP